jgi:lipopolysaccharide/colanic/teichoic acid biosynthesis glycosyltransferase
MTTESLAEQYERLSREGLERRRVDAALGGLDLRLAGWWLVVLSPALVLVAAASLLPSGAPLL